MRKNRWIIIEIVALIFVCLPSEAQDKDSDDFGIRVSAGVEKKIREKWIVGLEGDFYAKNNVSEIDRWGGEVSLIYELTRWLKASTGYKLIYEYNPLATTCHASGSINKYIPAYWRIRHRFNISLTGNVVFGCFNLSFRERWQYIYSPEKTVQQYVEDAEVWEDKTLNGKGKNVLRSRFQIKYNIQNSNFEPYVSTESYNSWKLTRIRYTIGTDYKFTKQHSISLYYRYQKEKDAVEPSIHILGIGYKFKF